VEQDEAAAARGVAKEGGGTRLNEVKSASGTVKKREWRWRGRNGS